MHTQTHTHPWSPLMHTQTPAHPPSCTHKRTPTPGHPAQPYRSEFSFCNFPFVYDPASKARVLQMENQMAQYSELQSALFRWGGWRGAHCAYYAPEGSRIRIPHLRLLRYFNRNIGLCAGMMVQSRGRAVQVRVPAASRGRGMLCAWLRLGALPPASSLRWPQACTHIVHVTCLTLCKHTVRTATLAAPVLGLLCTLCKHTVRRVTLATLQTCAGASSVATTS